ncbi:MAG: BACON domain-containing carbohydrate-binding protein [Candidatus Cryptobacteroides sp.]|nr:BACON domain-containing carbohydrate-binding protein [Bacteroidales bacterium]MDY5495652.1 BACON domain-containing carbohydrate-binding protein [Candidatus Cryptobacteroides sp.]
MKMKKFFYFAMSAVIASAMTSCGEEEEVLGPASLKAEVSEVRLAAEGETKTFELKATRDWTAEIIGTDVAGIEVSPLSGKASNDPVTITVKAAKNEGKNRTATIKFTASATLTAIVTITQEGAQGNLKSIADVLALSSGIEAETEGVVVGTYNRGFVIMDETGYLLAYNAAYTEPGVELNSKVKVAGTTAVYGDLPQLSIASVTTLETGLTVAEPNWLNVNKDNIENLDLTKCQPIKMTGVLSISGYYYNLSIDGTTVQGSISYPLESLGLADLAGHEITVYGYFAGGNNAKFRNMMAVKVTDNGQSETPVSTIAEIIAAETGTLVKTEATVMAIHKKGFILGDATGTIYVYTNDEPAVAVGNKILISGTTDNHYGTVQIKSATIEENDGSTATPTYPEPVDLTGLEAFNAFTVNTDKIDITYAKLSGVMQSSGYFLKRDGANHDIQLSNIYESYTDLAGAEFTVTGYIYGFNAGSNYYQVIPVSVETEPYLRAEKTEVECAGSDTSVSFAIKSNTSWTVSCDDAWIIDYTKSGNGDGSVTVSFAENSGAQRTATFTVKATGLADVVVTLDQQAAGTVAPVLVYTLSPVAGKDNSYANAGADIEVEGISWSVQGNNTVVPWRIGGKSLSRGKRLVYSTAPIADNIKKVVVEHGAASSITVNDLTLTVHNSKEDAASGENPVSTVSVAFAANDSVTFNSDADWTGKYYRFTYTVTVEGDKNKFFEFKKAEFYK